MRTNVDLDDELVKEAFRLSQAKTKKELIRQALKEYIENRRRLNLLELEGKIEFAQDYDHKSMRTGK
jgi:Arc/MetJ family transcription regulator